MEKTDTTSTIRRYAPIIIKSYVGYKVLFFVLLTHPFIFKQYLKFNRDVTPKMPPDAPTQITEAREIFHVHTYEEALAYMGMEPVVFRNYVNCAEKFETVLYPRRKEVVDHVEVIKFHEEGPGNVMMPGHTRMRQVIPKTLQQIWEEESTEYFPAFLQLFNDDDYQVLLNAKNGTHFAVESSLISHFNKSLVTTATHADQRTSSMAIQCYGSRSFLFHKLSDLKKHGFMPIPIIHGGTIRGTPDTINKIPTIRAIINPGDVVYFPPMYYHAVAASKGRNVLFSIRKADGQALMQSFRMSPSFLAAAILRVVYRNIFHKPKKSGFHFGGDYMPYFDEFLSEIFHYRQNHGFKEYDGLADFGLPDN